jgi:hypothetical protein
VILTKFFEQTFHHSDTWIFIRYAAEIITPAEISFCFLRLSRLGISCYVIPLNAVVMATLSRVQALKADQEAVTNNRTTRYQNSLLQFNKHIKLPFAITHGTTEGRILNFRVCFDKPGSSSVISLMYVTETLHAWLLRRAQKYLAQQQAVSENKFCVVITLCTLEIFRKWLYNWYIKKDRFQEGISHSVQGELNMSAVVSGNWKQSSVQSIQLQNPFPSDARNRTLFKSSGQPFPKRCTRYNI